jgi:hypothetical protein
MEFEDPKEEHRAQLEWVLVNLVRELRGIATDSMPTYYNSIKLSQQLMPKIFTDTSYMVNRHHEPELVRSYRQQAEGQSKLDGVRIDPLTLVEKKITELTKLIATDIPQKDLLKRDLERHQAIRSFFQPKKLSEDFILAHDVKSFKNGLEPINIKAKHSDYKINEHKILRVRLIHPDQGEQSLGADMIYEQYDSKNKMVRLIVVQYKIWDSKALYWSQASNLDAQIQKMSDNLCASHFCVWSDGKKHGPTFRYPFCSAFLRPTDKLQYKDSPLTSSGMHIPICRLGDVTEGEGSKKILKRPKMIENSINQTVFEECFNNNQIGTRWMTYGETEQLYVRHKILEDGERIIIHAQELAI